MDQPNNHTLTPPPDIQHPPQQLPLKMGMGDC